MPLSKTLLGKELCVAPRPSDAHILQASDGLEKTQIAQDGASCGSSSTSLDPIMCILNAEKVAVIKEKVVSNLQVSLSFKRS